MTYGHDIDDLIGELPPKRGPGRPPGSAKGNDRGGRAANPYRDALMREQTRIAKLKADALAGRLVEADAVERAWGALVLDLRAGLLALPSRVGARLGLSPAHVAVLDRELRDALEALGSVQAAEGPQARP